MKYKIIVRYYSYPKGWSNWYLDWEFDKKDKALRKLNEEKREEPDWVEHKLIKDGKK